MVNSLIPLTQYPSPLYVLVMPSLTPSANNAVFWPFENKNLGNKHEYDTGDVYNT